MLGTKTLGPPWKGFSQKPNKKNKTEVPHWTRFHTPKIKAPVSTVFLLNLLGSLRTFLTHNVTLHKVVNSLMNSCDSVVPLTGEVLQLLPNRNTSYK